MGRTIGIRQRDRHSDSGCGDDVEQTECPSPPQRHYHHYLRIILLLLLWLL